MSLPAGILIWAVIVIVSMVIVAYLARRWGRDPFGWALLAAAMGPIAAVGLIGTRRSDLRSPTPFEAAPSASAPDGAPILAACEGGASSQRIAQYIAAMHRPGAAVVLLTVLPHEARQKNAGTAAAGEHQRRVDAATLEVSKTLGDARMRPRVVVGYGDPAEEILRCAAEMRAQPIIVGRRGAGLTKALLGSVSDRVVRDAKAPVVVVE